MPGAYYDNRGSAFLPSKANFLTDGGRSSRELTALPNNNVDLTLHRQYFSNTYDIGRGYKRPFIFVSKTVFGRDTEFRKFGASEGKNRCYAPPP